MSERRRHSKIGKLPLKVRVQVERKLIDGVTYAKISEYLKDLGYDISLTSVHRYGKPFLNRYEAVKRASEDAKLLLRM